MRQKLAKERYSFFLKFDNNFVILTQKCDRRTIALDKKMGNRNCPQISQSYINITKICFFIIFIVLNCKVIYNNYEII